jgi:hypothetical protein
MMKKSSTFLWVGIFVLSFFCSPSVWALPGTSCYRIQYKNCTLSTDATRAIGITDTLGKASWVKIQFFKKTPASILYDANGISTNAPHGTLYMTAPLTIPTMGIDGDLGKLYTEANIGQLISLGTLTNLTCNKSWISVLISGKTIGSLRVSAQADSSVGQYATMILDFENNQPQSPMAIQLSGVILEKAAVLIPISNFTVASKKCVGGEPVRRFVSLGGVGQVTPAAQADSGKYPLIVRSIGKLKTSGAELVPDTLTCYTSLLSISAVSAQFDGKRLGGGVGNSDPARSDIEIWAGNIGSVYGNVGVNATFLAGLEGVPEPGFHQGTIQKIATHPTKGFLKGLAHVAPDSTIKFVPASHPYFWVCDDPAADQP